MPSIPLSNAPRVGSPSLMTGRLIPVNSPESKLSGVSASDLQNDPERSWVNLWSPKQVIPTTPKTMDNPPPEPPLPHTRRDSFSEPHPRLVGNYKPKKIQTDEITQNDENGFFGSVGDKFNDLYNRAGQAWDNANPMEKGLIIGIPTALAAGAGALYFRKKRREANKAASR